MKPTFFLFALFSLFVISVLACAPEPAARAQPISTPAPITAGDVVIAEGRVVPARRAALSFKVGGTVARVPVAVGDQLQAGQTIAQLETRELELSLAQSEANLAMAQAKLDQLRRGAVAQDRAAAQQSLVFAQAAYDNLIRPNDQELIALKAGVEKARALHKQAQAAYDRIGGDTHPYAAMTMERAQLEAAWLDYEQAMALYNLKVEPPQVQVQQALTAVQNAKSQLAKLDATAEELAAAEASVRAALATRDLAAEQLKNATLGAPFGGVITAIDLREGEFVAPGTPVVRLGDLSVWEIETTDLAESGVAVIGEGARATMTFDALPDLELDGQVSRINLFGENRQGDIVYTVTITPSRPDDRLRWNMTASVKIAKRD